MHFVNQRDKHLDKVSSGKSYFKLYDMVSFLYWSGRRIASLLNLLLKLSVLNECLKVIPGISMAMTYFDFLHDFISSTLVSERSLHTKIFKTVLLLISAPIIVASFILTTKLLNVAASALNMVNNLWDIGTVVCSKLFGILKNNTDKELNRAANYKIAEKSHMLFINAGFLIGTILLLNPATFVAGCVILLGITTYAIADRFNKNPLRSLANKIFNNPFKKDITRDESEIIDNEQSTAKVIDLLQGKKTATTPRNTSCSLDDCLKTSNDKNVAFFEKAKTPTVKANEYFASAIEQRLGSRYLSSRSKQSP